MSKQLYLGADGKFHLRKHGNIQKITVDLPLGFILSHRCHECGAAFEYEKVSRGKKEQEVDNADDL